MPANAAPPPAAPRAEEGAERGRKRNRAEALERCALGALTALEDGAFLAFAQVSAQGAAFRAREALLIAARERERCLAAREAAFELFSQSPARAEDQGLDGADRDIEDLGDLGVRASLELAHDERCALVEAEEPEGAADLARARHIAVLGAAGRRLSSNSTSCGRRDESRKRCRQTLWAILISQLCGRSGRSPRWNAR